MRLCDRYRPTSLDGLLGQPKIVARLRALMNRPDWDRDAFWIVGPSGTGKTTLAQILGHAVAREDIDITELDGERCTIDAVRAAADAMRYRALGGGWRVWIVNEAQAMTGKAVQAWLTVLDALPPHVLVVFTTTSDSADIFGEFEGPFRSRCKPLEFTNQGLAKVFAARLREIAVAEGLDGRPESAYLTLIQSCRQNFRAALQRIEAGEMLLVEGGAV